MTLRLLLSVYAISQVLGGAAWLLLPAQNLALYGVAADGVAITLCRYAGTLGIGLGLIAWGARAADASPARNAVVLGITVATTLSAIACLLGALSGNFNVAAWVPTGFYALFAVLFLVVGQKNNALTVAPSV